MLLNVGSGGAPAAAAAGGAPAGGDAAAADAPAAEEKKEEAKEESDDGEFVTSFSMAVHGKRNSELTMCLYRHGIRSLRLSAHSALAGAARFLDMRYFHDRLGGSGGCGCGCSNVGCTSTEARSTILYDWRRGGNSWSGNKMPSNDVLLCADSRRVGTVKTMESAWLGHGCALLHLCTGYCSAKSSSWI